MSGFVRILIVLLMTWYINYADKQVYAAELKVTESTFAVFTHKSGVAAKLAHNHMIAAEHSAVTVNYDDKVAANSKFTFETKIADLEVDDDAIKADLWAKIHGRGIYDELPPPVPADTRAQVTKTMLSKDVLWASKYPTVRAEVTGLMQGENTVKVTIRGVTKEYKFTPKWDFAGGIFTAEAIVAVKGTDFGIEPYTAALGAIKNEDAMELYINFKAK